MRYRHTQFGAAMVSILAVAAAVLMLLLAREPDAALWPPLAVLALVAVLFSSMTISVDDEHLRWYFGPGFWRKSLALADIESSARIRTRWFYGLGIRRIPSGWLYCVSGLDAVELRLLNGKTVSLGTDDADRLLRALQVSA